MADQRNTGGASGWRGRSTGRSTKKTASSLRLSLALLLLAIAAIVGGVVALAFMAWPSPKPTLAGYWVASYVDPRISVDPTSEADREAIKGGDYFGKVDEQVGENWQKVSDVLKARKSEEPILLYVSANACLDAAGNVLILPPDIDPEAPASGLPLKQVLTELQGCKSENKFLILDISRPMADPSLGILTNDVASRAAEEVEALSDPGRLVLMSCSPGEVSLSSELLGRSIFNYYVEESLRGWADSQNDGKLKAREVADYVKSHVEDWARRARDKSQTPMLLGAPAADFTLTVLDASGHKPHLAEEPRLKTALSGDATKEPAEAAPKAEGKAEPKSATAIDYPKWLADGWQLARGWRDANATRIAPRPLARLEATLLRAEREWRFGGNAERVRAAYLKREELARAQYQMASSPRRPSRLPSVALEVAFKGEPKPALVAAVRDAFAARALLKPGLTAEEVAPAIKALLEKNKPEGEAELSAAVLDTLADVQPSQYPLYLDLLKFANAILLQYRTQTLKPADAPYIETQLIQNLVATASALPPGQPTGSPWRPERLKSAVDSIRRGERLEAQADAFPWVKPLVARAAVDRHIAGVLFNSPGYLSSVEVEDAWKASSTLDQKLADLEDSVIEAGRVLAEAKAILPSLVAYLDQSGDEEAARLWSELATAAGELASSLTPPSEKDAQERWTQESFSRPRIDEWKVKSENLRAGLESLRSLFSTSVVDALILDTTGTTDAAGSFGRIDDMLRTPLLAGESRIRLVEALRSLDRTLHKKHFEATSMSPSGYDTSTARTAELKRSRDRADWSLALLSLGGIDVSPAAEPRQAFAGKLDAETRNALTKAVWSLWKGVGGTLDGDATAAGVLALESIASPLTIVPALDNGRVAPPTTLERAGREAMLWTWMAEHYRYLGRFYRCMNPDADPPSFISATLTSLESFAKPVPDRYGIMIVKDLSVRDPILTALNPAGSTALKVSLIAGAGDAPEPTYRILGAADPRLRLTLAGPPQQAASGDSSRLGIQIELRQDGADANPSKPSSPVQPRGLLVEAMVAGQPFLYRGDVSLGSALEPLRLVLSGNPKEPTSPQSSILLRPIESKQSYYLYVKNPTDKVRKVEVRLLTKDGEAPISRAILSVPPRQTSRVEAFEGQAPPAPQPGTPAAAPAGPAPVELTTGLTIRLLDTAVQPDDPTATLDEIKPGVDLIAPTELIQVIEPRFTPANPTNQFRNELSVKVRAKTNLPDGPCAVGLVLNSDLLPGLKGIQLDAQLSGVLKAVGDEVTLSARGIDLEPMADERGSFLISVDGDLRALKYRANFARDGDLPVQAMPDKGPAFHVRNPSPIAPIDKPYEVSVSADNPPDRSRLLVGLGTEADGKFMFRDFKEIPARRKKILLTADPKGALIFAASVSDQVVSLDPKGLIGNAILQVGLTSGGTDVVDPKRFAIRFDGPPKGVEIISTEVQGLAVDVKAVGTGAVAIDSVKFFFGKPEGDKIPDPKAAVDAVQLENGTWSARLPLPKDAQGKLVIGVQFTNQLGLSSFNVASITIAPTMAASGPGGDPAGDAAKTPKTGIVTGKVSFGEIAQPKVAVQLYNLKADTVVSKGTTDDKGIYTIKDVPPGNYILYTERPALNAKAQEQVAIRAGMTETVNLSIK